MEPNLPTIKQYADFSIDEPHFLISVAGFEDRATVIYKKLIESESDEFIDGSVGIKYKPYDPRNDVQGVENGFSTIGIQNDMIKWVKFDRFHPDTFGERFRESLKERPCDKALLDISGMSKFLIMLSLHILSDLGVEVTIFYAEADVYHPTKQEFEKKKNQPIDKTPAFLTSGVYDIVSAPSLSSVVKGGQPIVIVAFPTFNHREMMALVSEISPHHLVSIEGLPRLKEDEWRADAISWLNRETNSYIRVDRHRVSTFSYEDTFDLLNDIYDEYADAYRLLLSPTGSKLQTVGAALFRRIHSDIQVVYPVTKKFSDTYTEGCKKSWVVELGKMDELLEEFSTDTEDKIEELRKKITDLSNKTDAD